MNEYWYCCLLYKCAFNGVSSGNSMYRYVNRGRIVLPIPGSSGSRIRLVWIHVCAYYACHPDVKMAAAHRCGLLLLLAALFLAPTPGIIMFALKGC